VQADLEIGEQRPCRAHRRIGLRPLLLVVGECLAQQLLSVRRMARPQLHGECREGRRFRRGVSWDLFEEPGEFATDFFEHFQVPGGNGFAGALECVERRVDRDDHSPEPALRIEQPFAEKRAIHRLQRLEQSCVPAEPAREPLQQVFAANRAAGLARRPRRKRAPVGCGAKPRPHRRGELRVAGGDLEVANDAILDRGDVGDILLAGNWRGVHKTSLPITYLHSFRTKR
jgi:hypothetical protein